MPESGGLDEGRLSGALAGRRVLLTGHTGFKGGWMALWLKRLGADVVGVALPPQPGPSLFDHVGLDRQIDSRFTDIRDRSQFAAAVEGVEADAIVHMAAQAIVRQSHSDPVDTYLTNVVGTAVVLDAARAMPSCRAIVVVTSDKCYENLDWPWGYRETDRLGGADPYSNSKACTELVADSFRRSFFAHAGAPRLATVRAGNVFGGGDWAADRLVPDIVRATLCGDPTFIRNPGSIRPWQHVLEPLSGYLAVLAGLLEGEDLAEAWNFGPDPVTTVDVGALARMMAETWGPGGPRFRFGSPGESGPAEARTLALDSQKARVRLGWQPRLALPQAVALTIDWYRRAAAGVDDMRAVCLQQIETYVHPTSAPIPGEYQQCA